MPLSAAQIVTQATLIAKCPGYIQLAGQLLNAALSDLCQTYDFEVARGTFYFNFQPGLIAPVGNSIFGSGPYPLPADYLRAQKDGVFWTLLGVPYFLTSCDISEFDMQVQQAGVQSYPYLYATDLSLSDEAANGDATPVMYVYSPPSGAYPVTVRYYRQMPDIATPETSATVPWFPNQQYLITRLAGELMRITGDDRQAQFLGEGPDGAQGILRRYLELKDDRSSRAQRITLDRRRFGRNWSRLPNSKTVGWLLAICAIIPFLST